MFLIHDSCCLSYENNSLYIYQSWKVQNFDKILTLAFASFFKVKSFLMTKRDLTILLFIHFFFLSLLCEYYISTKRYITEKYDKNLFPHIMKFNFTLQQLFLFSTSISRSTPKKNQFIFYQFVFFFFNFEF